MNDLKSNRKESCIISGADFCKYYHRPLDTEQKSDESAEDADVFSYLVYDPSIAIKEEKFLTKATQTDYRESSAQTEPWDPPYKVCSNHKEPEILSLKNFRYGSDLPVGVLEVQYLARKRELRNLESDLKQDGDSNVNIDILKSQTKNEWNYRNAASDQKQAEKLTFMQNAITEELRKHSNRKRSILKNIWTAKKDELKDSKMKLEKKLQKELKLLDSSFGNEDNSDFSKFKASHEKNTPVKQKKTNEIKKETDFLLSNYYVSDPTGLSTVRKWLETKTSTLTASIPLPKSTKRTQRERLAEQAYQDLLEKKKTKMPPQADQEEFKKEDAPAPTVRTEDVLELLDFEEEDKDSVVVWQQVLRGLAYQKQMLELIDHHKDGLSTILSSIYPGINMS